MSSFFVTADTCLRDPCDCPEEKALGLWHAIVLARRLQRGPSANVPHDRPGLIDTMRESPRSPCISKCGVPRL